MITIHINDEPTQLTANTTLKDAITQWSGYQPEQPYALAINGEFIARTQHNKTTVQNNDKIDVVSPVGGG